MLLLEGWGCKQVTRGFWAGRELNGDGEELGMTGNTGAASVAGARSSGRRDGTYRREGGRDSIHHGWLWMGGKVRPHWLQRGRGRREARREAPRAETRDKRAGSSRGGELAGPAWGPPQNSEVSGAVAHIRAYWWLSPKTSCLCGCGKGFSCSGPHSHPGRPRLFSTTTHNHHSCQWKPLCPSELVCCCLHARVRTSAHTHTHTVLY